VALTTPENVTGTPDVTVVGTDDWRVKLGMDVTTVTVSDPDITQEGPAAEAVMVMTVPIPLGADSSTAVEVPKLNEATSSPL